MTNKKVEQLIEEGVLYAPMDGNHGEKHPKTSDYVEKGVPFILVPDLVDGIVDLDNCNYISEEQAKTLRKGFSKTGDVLFTHKATIGKVALVDTQEYEYIILTPQVTYYRIKDNEVLCNEYLYYYFQSHTFQETFRLFASSGGTRDYLGIVAQQKLPIIFPEIKVQKDIVAVLKNYDNLIHNNNKRIKILEQMAENLYKEWFVRFRFPGHENAEFENGIPKGWEVCKVKTMVDRLPFGKLYKADDVQPDGKVIVIDQSTDEYVGFHSDEPSHIASIDNPIALFGDHSCKYQLMITPFSLSENVIPYRATENNRLIWLYFVLYGIVETTEYKRHWSEFTAKKILKAPIELQMSFEKKCIPILKLIQSLKVMNRNLKKQRDKLLPRLMSGKLEI